MPGRPITGIFPFYEFADRFDIWKYIPMDQGGRLVQLQVIGSESDADITAALRRKSFFKPWGNLATWDSLESTEIEKSVWLNRWYYLPSFARQFRVTGDRAYLDDLLKLLRKWVVDNPVPEDLPKYFSSGKYIWRDMQVAWRTHNLIWCYFLGKNGFTDEERSEIYAVIETHALALFAYFRNQRLHRNNHQSHGALALLYAGILFPKLKSSGKYRSRAISILNHHLKNAFYADGNSVELCPGYYPFFASIFRDAFLLCRANNIKLPTNIRSRLIQFHDFLSTVAQPDGTMPPINDSSESDATVSCLVLGEILKRKPQTARSHHFVNSGQAVMRDETMYLFIDAGPQMLWHWHGGKLGFHFWAGHEPVIVDSGICNYDDPRRVSWYCKPDAHNTLLVDGIGDYERATIPFGKEPIAECGIVRWESNRRYDLVTMVHNGFASRNEPVRWVRYLMLVKGKFTLVVDEVISAGVHEYTWPFHFAPGKVTVERKARCVRTTASRQRVTVVPADPGNFDSCRIESGWVNRRSEAIASPVVRFTSKGTTMIRAFCLVPVSRAGRSDISVRQIVQRATINIEISGGSKNESFSIARYTNRD